MDFDSKKFILFFAGLSLSLMPVRADIIWPSVYIIQGMTSLFVIFFGFLAETAIIRYFAKINWKKAFAVSFVMNLVSTLLGIILIPLSGLCAEFIFDFIFRLYANFGIGTFHWTHWLASYLIVIILNTLIEGLCVRQMLKLKLKQTFWWLLCANALSVLVCFVLLILRA